MSMRLLSPPGVAGLAIAMLASCGIRTSPLIARSARGATAATTVYQVEELQFEAPSGWVPKVNADTLKVQGRGDCAMPVNWGAVWSRADSSDNVRGNCPTIWAGPVENFTPEACLDEDLFTRRFSRLATSTEWTRSSPRLDGRVVRRFDREWRLAQPGLQVIGVICSSPRPWFVAVWVPRDVRSEGEAALALFLGTLRFLPDRPSGPR